MDDSSTSLLEMTRRTFAEATEASTLKQAARALKEARTREEDVLQQGAKAVIQAVANDDDDELGALEAELRLVQDSCTQLERDLESLNKEPDAALREAHLASELRRLQELEEGKIKEFEIAGGEARLRRQAKVEGSTSLHKMKKLLTLYHHITRIKWDMDAAEDETAGMVIDNNEHVIKQFRFGPIRKSDGELDTYAISTKVWQSIA